MSRAAPERRQRTGQARGRTAALQLSIAVLVVAVLSAAGCGRRGPPQRIRPEPPPVAAAEQTPDESAREQRQRPGR